MSTMTSGILLPRKAGGCDWRVKRTPIQKASVYITITTGSEEVDSR